MQAKTTVRRMLALLLCLSMLAGILPAALADGDTPVRIEDTDSAVTYAPEEAWGIWEDVHFSNTNGASITVRFTGTEIRIFGQKAKNGPYADVTIDGESSGRANFYAPSTSDYNQLVYTSATLEDGEHTLVMTMTDELSPEVGAGEFANAQAAVNYFLVSTASGTTEPTEPVEDGVTFWTTNSYVNPFRDFTRETTPMADDKIELLMARNDRESAQILLRSENAFTVSGVEFSALSSETGSIAAENLKWNFVDYHYMSNSAGQNASTAVRWGRDYYPDRLSNDTSRTVEAGSTQSVWLTVYAPAGTKAGTYTGTAKVLTDKGTVEVPVSAEVVDVEIPAASDAKFELAYWQNISGTWNWSGMNSDRYIVSRLFNIEKWSDEWWGYVASAADAMEEARINVLHIQPLELLMDGGSTVENYDDAGNAVYHFNWDKFDAYVQYFLSRGFVKKLEFYHLLNTRYSSHTEPTILIPNPDYDAQQGFSYTNRPLMIEEVAAYFGSSDGTGMAPRVEAFYDQYIRALDAHLKEKGWIDMAYQHVEDECISAREQREYKHMAEFFRARTNIPFGDPIDSQNTAFMTANAMLQFPLSSIYDSNRAAYQTWIAAHPETVMMYTCLNPQGRYLNKFIDKPVWQMRLQTWYSYAEGVTGHLHWAWDAGWTDASRTDGQGAGTLKDISTFNYKGDDFVVWPDVEEKKVESSIRAASIRDGAEDYEVFAKLAEKGTEYQTWLKQQIGTVVRSNSDYDSDIEKMIAVRKNIYLVAGGQKDISCTVCLHSNYDGDETQNVRTLTGMALGEKMPENPVRMGWLFTGWNTEPDGTGEAFTAETVVEKNMDVYAQWLSANAITDFVVNGLRGEIDENSHTVQLTLPAGTDVTSLRPQIVLSAGASSAPASGEAQDFTNPVSYKVTAADGVEQIWVVTVSAAGAQELCTVTWNTKGGVPGIDAIQVPQNSRITEPVHDMKLEGYLFEGWYRDEACTQKWDFRSDRVTSDITLYANWVTEGEFTDFSDGSGEWIDTYGNPYTSMQIIDDPDAYNGKALYFRGISQTGPKPLWKNGGTYLDGVLEMRVKVDGSTMPTLGVGFRNPGVNGAYNGICFEGNGKDKRILTDMSTGIGENNWCDPWTDARQEINPGQYYTIKVAIRDQAVTVTVDGTTIIENDTSWPNWGTEAGYVGLYGWGITGNYYIDYIRVIPGSQTTDTYQVTFDAQNGTTPVVQKAAAGSRLSAPEKPVKDGWAFGGWYRNIACTDVWDFETDTVYTHMTLYAKWVKLSGEKEITAFHIEGFEDCEAVIDAEAHTVTITLPAGATENYLTPILSVSDKATVVPKSGLAVKFEKGAASIYTVTAEDGSTQQWLVTVNEMDAGTYRVIWETNGGQPVPTQTSVSKDGSIAEPAEMTRKGYEFEGWYEDAEFTIAARFPYTNVTSDMTFYAKWTGVAEAAYFLMTDPHITGAGDQARIDYAMKFVNSLLPDGYDGMVIAGDLTSDGDGDSQMKYVSQILDRWKGNGPAAEYVVRGNHDTTSAMATLSTDYYPDNSGYTVRMGGFYFVMYNSEESGAVQKEWLRAQLAQITSAEDYSSGDPIFVVMHTPIDLSECLNAYPQIICLTGHTHRDLYDEAAILQSGCTMVHLGGMQYIEFPGNHIEGEIPAQTGLLHADGSQSQMNQGIVMTVYGDRITFDRYDFSIDRHIGTWEIARPLTEDSFTYTAENRDREAPEFSEDAAVRIDMNASTEVEFSYPQAADNAYVYDYHIELKKDGNRVASLDTLSQFYAAEVPARKSSSFTGLSTDTEYTIEITARDAAGNTSGVLSGSFRTTSGGALGNVQCDKPEFDMDVMEPVRVRAVSENNELRAVRYGDSALRAGKDYTISGDEIQLLPALFEQFEAGAVVRLSFVFAKGDPVELAITVTSSRYEVVSVTRDFEDGSLEGFQTYRQNYLLSIEEANPLDGMKSLAVTTGRNGKQMLIDTNVPQIKNGTLEFDMKASSFGTMCFIVRGLDDQNHLAIGCDRNGGWLWVNMLDGVETFGLKDSDGLKIEDGKTYHLKLSFYGDYYELYVDDTCVLRSIISGLNLNAGYIGLHNWGSTARTTVFDNVKLTYAVEKQTAPVDKAALRALYDSNKNRENENYTDESWKQFEDALKTAGQVLAQEDATQEQVDQAEKALREAVNGLTRKNDQPITPVTPVRPVRPVRPAENVKKLPFVDVAPTSWYYESVREAWSSGLIDGMTATEFRPEEQLTVAQAIKLAAALHQMQMTGSVTLTNGSPNWYDSYVSYAVNNGVIEKNYLNYTSAQMNAPATRGEFVHIFYGALLDAAVINTVADNKIPDVKTTDKYGAEIYAFYRAGITVGSDAAGTFRPASSIKRSEVAAILQRMFDASARKSITLN